LGGLLFGGIVFLTAVVFVLTAAVFFAVVVAFVFEAAVLLVTIAVFFCEVVVFLISCAGKGFMNEPKMIRLVANLKGILNG